MQEQHVEFQSGDAMFVFDTDLRVRSWNAAAERLTGVPESEAVGRHCWQLLGGAQPDGSLTCHARCSHARLASGGWPVRCLSALIRTASGPRLIALSTIVVRNGGEPTLIHLMRDAAPQAADHSVDGKGREAPRLTPRQREVFQLMARGMQAKAICRELGLSEATVRNHIPPILLALGCTSQLAAVARGRALGIVS